ISNRPTEKRKIARGPFAWGFRSDGPASTLHRVRAMSLQILILEDDIRMQTQIGAALAGGRYRLIFAVTQEELFRHLDGEPPFCMVLLDPFAREGTLDGLFARLRECPFPIATMPVGLSGSDGLTHEVQQVRRLLSPGTLRRFVEEHCRSILPFR